MAWFFNCPCLIRAKKLGSSFFGLRSSVFGLRSSFCRHLLANRISGSLDNTNDNHPNRKLVTSAPQAYLLPVGFKPNGSERYINFQRRAMLSWCLSLSRCCFNKLSAISLLVYGISFLGIFPFLFKDMRYSLYYQNPFHNKTTEMAYHIKQNEMRSAVASQFWNALQSEPFNFTKTVKDVDIDVVIITTSRFISLPNGNSPRFLTQVLWQFFQILNSTETKQLPWKFGLSICNVDPQPYEEAQNFSSLVQYIQRYSVEPESLPAVYIKEKEKQDYAFCLEESMKSRPRYSLLVEDDAFPHPQLFQTLYYHIEEKKRLMDSRLQTNNVLFYKLYHPERLQGFWSLEPERLPELFSCGCVCGTFVTFLMHHLLCSKENRRCKPKNVFNIWIWVVFYFTIAAFLINRPHLMQLRYLSKYFFTVGPTPSCCTPGMLFVAEKASHWVNYMKTHTCGVNYGKDTMLDDYRKKFKVKGLIVQPNLFTHIGFYSSLSQKLLGPSLMYYPPWFPLY